MGPAISASTRAYVAEPEGRPSICSNAGTTRSLKVTKQLTGLPGRAKASLWRSPLCAVGDGEGTVANVVGLPGFMHISPKCTCPSSSSSGFMWSRLPRLTPPEVTTMSADCRAARSCWRNEPGSSHTMPKSTASAPASSTKASNIGRLQSTICPRLSSRVAAADTSTSSSPVENMATTGRRWTSTLAKPRAANTPISPGPMREPRRRTTSPWAVSEPTLRMFAPGLLATPMSIRRTPSTHTSFESSTLTTASAPSGRGAPVVT
mmetsp:Transcript_45923/g.130182  ORF Transcript_45923/g.130182 Transcript_45923/m.130182 type:complete len:263 (+) Transcript_45923:802-1590(+)